MDQTSMNGKYYRTSMNDIRSSEGWFGKICLLGLINFIPIFGQMTVMGYAYEWAHKAAWGLSDPMPKKIYGRQGSKMLRWGWFVLVIAIVFAIVPSIISGIGNAITSSGSASTVYVGGTVRTIGSSNPALLTIGGIISLIAWVLMLAAGIFSWVGNIRMTVYDRLGAGLQFGKIWKMAKHDFGGLMRIFGMELIWGIITGLIIGVIIVAIATVIFGASLLPAVAASQSGMASQQALAGYLLTASAISAPFFLIVAYIASVVSTVITLLVARAVGYWARQFEVGSWGPQDAPMPFEAQQAQQAQYQQPQQPYQQQATWQQPQQPQAQPYQQAQPAQPAQPQHQPYQQAVQPEAQVQEPVQAQAAEQAQQPQQPQPQAQAQAAEQAQQPTQAEAPGESNPDTL